MVNALVADLGLGFKLSLVERGEGFSLVVYKSTYNRPAPASPISAPYHWPVAVGHVGVFGAKLSTPHLDLVRIFAHEH